MNESVKGGRAPDVALCKLDPGHWGCSWGIVSADRQGGWTPTTPPPAYSSSVVHLMLLALCSELHDGEIYVSLSVLLTTESVVSIIVLQTYSVIILSIICIILCYYIILYILNMQYVHKTVDLYTY